MANGKPETPAEPQLGENTAQPLRALVEYRIEHDLPWRELAVAIGIRANTLQTAVRRGAISARNARKIERFLGSTERLARLKPQKGAEPPAQEPNGPAGAVEAVLQEYEQAIFDNLGLDPGETLCLAEYLEGMRYWFRKCGVRTREDLERLTVESGRSFYDFLAHQPCKPMNDLRALTAGYYREHAFDAERLPADFHEWIGRLALCGTTTQERKENRKTVLALMRVADQPLSILKSSAQYRHWYPRLLPLAERAGQFIQHERREQPGISRQGLWERYFDSRLRERAAYERVNQDLALARAQREGLPVPAEPSGEKPTTRAAGSESDAALREGHWPGGKRVFVGHYTGAGMVPKPLFLLCAETKPRTEARRKNTALPRRGRPPSEAVRVYLQRELRISWSLATRKSSRKKP